MYTIVTIRDQLSYQISLCLSSSQTMYWQLNATFSRGTPGLCHNITLFVPNVPGTLYIALPAIYCTNIMSLCIMLAYNAPHRRSCCYWKLPFPAKRGMSFTSRHSRQVKCTPHCLLPFNIHTFVVICIECGAMSETHTKQYNTSATNGSWFDQEQREFVHSAYLQNQ